MSKPKKNMTIVELAIQLYATYIVAAWGYKETDKPARRQAIKTWRNLMPIRQLAWTAVAREAAALRNYH